MPQGFLRSAEELLMELQYFVQQYWAALLVLLVSAPFILRPRRSSGVGRSRSASTPKTRHTAAAHKVRLCRTSMTIRFAPGESSFAEIVSALERGQKPEAVQLLRDAKGLDLAVATKAIEALDQNRALAARR